MRISRFGHGCLVVLVVLAVAACDDRSPENLTADAVATTVAVSVPASAPPTTEAATDEATADAATTDAATTDSASSDSATNDSATTYSFRSTWSTGAGIAWSKVALPAGIYPYPESGNTLLGTSWDPETELHTWWESDDQGQTWAEIPIPTPKDELTRAQADGVPWVAVSPDGGGRVMGSSSHREVLARTWSDAPGDPTLHRFVGGEWEQVDLSSFTPKSIPGLNLVGSSFAEGATLDADTWIVPMVSMFKVPWKKYYGDPDDEAQSGDVAPWPIWDWSTQRLGIHAPGQTGLARAVLTVDLADTGSSETPSIVFRDAENGQVVHTVEASLPGWEPEALLTALRGWGLDDLVLIVGNGDEVVGVRPPFTMGEEWGESVVVFDEAFYTFSYQLSTESETRYKATAVRLWRSEDGLQWSLVPSPPLQGTPLDWVSLVAGTNELMMTVHQQAGESLWTSTDGSHWQQVDNHAWWGDVTLEDPVPTEFGWIRAGTGGGWVSEDGLDWEHIDLPPPGGGEFPTVDYLGGVYFFHLELAEESGENAIWVGQYEPTTESSGTAPPSPPPLTEPPSPLEATDNPTIPNLWVGVRGFDLSSDDPIEPGGDVVELVGDGVAGLVGPPHLLWGTPSW